MPAAPQPVAEACAGCEICYHRGDHDQGCCLQIGRRRDELPRFAAAKAAELLQQWTQQQQAGGGSLAGGSLELAAARC